MYSYIYFFDKSKIFCPERLFEFFRKDSTTLFIQKGTTFRMDMLRKIYFIKEHILKSFFCMLQNSYIKSQKCDLTRCRRKADQFERVGKIQTATFPFLCKFRRKKKKGNYVTSMSSYNPMDLKGSWINICQLSMDIFS